MSMLTRLLSDRAGAMTIETALVAPILLTLSLGGVEAGSMVARQSELQSAAAEALNIVQAAPQPPEGVGHAQRLQLHGLGGLGLHAVGNGLSLPGLGGVRGAKGVRHRLGGCRVHSATLSPPVRLRH